MSQADELKDRIAAAAQEPAEATIDGETVKQHPLPDQIAAAKFVAGSDGVKRRHRGLRFTRIIPPGAA